MNKHSKILFHLLGVLGTLSIMMFGTLFYTGHYHQKKAEEFWGTEYDPGASSLPWNFPLSIVMAYGGPTIATEFSGCTETVFPVWPMKKSSTDSFQVLCGLVEPHVVTIMYEDIENKQIRDIIRDGF